MEEGGFSVPHTTLRWTAIGFYAILAITLQLESCDSMKRSSALCIAMLIILLFSGCDKSSEITHISTTVPPETTTVLPETTAATTVPPVTEASHSPLYIPGISVEEVISCFNEVCLQAEYINSGDPSVLQKWGSPIYYHLNGSYTTDDFETLSCFVDSLNEIEGFPGIQETFQEEEANLTIHFCDDDTLVSLMGDRFWGTDGAVTFWYTEDVIYQAIICYRDDIDQYTRNSVILEELYNGLGPIQDTFLREDSIIYAEFSQPQQLTDMDWLILKLLYHPSMQCGMDISACEAMIRQLYY